MKVFVVTKELNPKEPLITLPKSKVEYIVLHHAEATQCTWQDINAWHKQNGWSCAGYNEIIAKNGDVYVLRGDSIGAHTKGYNSNSYGICLEGDYSKEQMPQEQYNSLVARLKFHIERFKAKIVRHSDLNSSECPGKNFPFTQLINDVIHNISTDDAIKQLHSLNIISSPDYWQNNCIDGGNCNGAYVAKLIKNVVTYLKDK
jgi:hypothetical protein